MQTFIEAEKTREGYNKTLSFSWGDTEISVPLTKPIYKTSQRVNVRVVTIGEEKYTLKVVKLPKAREEVINETETSNTFNPIQKTHMGHYNYQDKDRYFIIKPYVEGEDLNKYLRHHPELYLSERKELILTLLYELYTILWQAGDIHRDLKPENLILNEGLFTIIDTAQAVRAGTLGTRVSGTPPYWTAEQSLRHIERPAEIWHDIKAFLTICTDILCAGDQFSLNIVMGNSYQATALVFEAVKNQLTQTCAELFPEEDTTRKAIIAQDLFLEIYEVIDKAIAQIETEPVNLVGLRRKVADTVEYKLKHIVRFGLPIDVINSITFMLHYGFIANKTMPEYDEYRKLINNVANFAYLKEDRMGQLDEILSALGYDEWSIGEFLSLLYENPTLAIDQSYQMLPLTEDDSINDYINLLNDFLYEQIISIANELTIINPLITLSDKLRYVMEISDQLTSISAAIEDMKGSDQESSEADELILKKEQLIALKEENSLRMVGECIDSLDYMQITDQPTTENLNKAFFERYLQIMFNRLSTRFPSIFPDALMRAIDKHLNQIDYRKFYNIDFLLEKEFDVIVDIITSQLKSKFPEHNELLLIGSIEKHRSNMDSTVILDPAFHLKLEHSVTTDIEKYANSIHMLHENLSSRFTIYSSDRITSLINKYLTAADYNLLTEDEYFSKIANRITTHIELEFTHHKFEQALRYVISTFNVSNLFAQYGYRFCQQCMILLQRGIYKNRCNRKEMHEIMRGFLSQNGIDIENDISEQIIDLGSPDIIGKLSLAKPTHKYFQRYLHALWESIKLYKSAIQAVERGEDIDSVLQTYSVEKYIKQFNIFIIEWNKQYGLRRDITTELDGINIADAPELMKPFLLESFPDRKQPIISAISTKQEGIVPNIIRAKTEFFKQKIEDGGQSPARFQYSTTGN
ncbi:MAG: hypothetical protein JXR42_04105 [Gammaproteobacteria bacterium]|nr:hypothetical protein [Gammaproteobacteria bacterium]